MILTNIFLNLKSNLNISFFINLIIFSLILGPALPDIIATSMSLIAIFLLIKYKKFDYNFYLLFLSFICLLLPNIFSPYFPNPFLEQLVNIRYFLFALFLSSFTNINLEKLMNFLLFITILLSLDLIFQFIFKFNIIGIPINPGHGLSRASSFFGDELIAGGFILKFGLPIIGYYAFLKKKYITIFLIILYEAAIIATGERMSFLLYILGIFLLILFNIREKRLIFLNITAVIFTILFTFLAFDEVRDRVDNFIESSGINESHNFLDSGYGAHFQAAYYIFTENKTFGTGHKTFRKHCQKESIRNKVNSSSEPCSTHPHNLYLELLSDSGLFGFISFLVFVILLFVKFLRSKLHLSPVNGFFVTFITIIWPISSSGNFFNNKIGVTNFLIIGLLIYFSKSNQLLKQSSKITKINSN